MGRIITTTDPEFGCVAITALGGSSLSGPWITANKPLAVPFTINDAMVVTHLGWRNGSAAGSNHDIGIYDEQWNRLVSAGSSAAGTSSIWNFVDVTDTPLGAGRYYLVKVIDATTANRARYWNTPATTTFATMLGLKETATDSFPLPNPLVGMTDPITHQRVPVLGIAVKAPL
jgi:hypothetical protein